VKKFLLIVLTCLLALALAACGGDDEPTPEPTAVPTEAPTVAPTEAPTEVPTEAPAAAEPVTATEAVTTTEAVTAAEAVTTTETVTTAETVTATEGVTATEEVTATDATTTAAAAPAVPNVSMTMPAGLQPGDAAAGKAVFGTLCFACHGPEGKGIPGLGKDMTTSEFIAGKTDEELFAFVRTGRPIDDPLNTTGVAMPPSGGLPTLSDQDLTNIIAFIRTIHVN